MARLSIGGLLCDLDRHGAWTGVSALVVLQIMDFELALTVAISAKAPNYNQIIAVA